MKKKLKLKLKWMKNDVRGSVENFFGGSLSCLRNMRKKFLCLTEDGAFAPKKSSKLFELDFSYKLKKIKQYLTFLKMSKNCNKNSFS